MKVSKDPLSIASFISLNKELCQVTTLSRIVREVDISFQVFNTRSAEAVPKVNIQTTRLVRNKSLIDRRVF